MNVHFLSRLSSTSQIEDSNSSSEKYTGILPFSLTLATIDRA
jgi:hypothetical protein